MGPCQCEEQGSDGEISCDCGRDSKGHRKAHKDCPPVLMVARHDLAGVEREHPDTFIRIRKMADAAHHCRCRCAASRYNLAVVNFDRDPFSGEDRPTGFPGAILSALQENSCPVLFCTEHKVWSQWAKDNNYMCCSPAELTNSMQYFAGDDGADNLAFYKSYYV